MIYVITKGCYSDYHICGVATSREIAEKMKKVFSDRYNEADIEEFQENEYPQDYFPTHYYECWLSEDGKQYSLREYWDINNLQIKINPHSKNAITVANIPYNNEEIVLKIARDARMQYLSEKFGL